MKKSFLLFTLFLTTTLFSLEITLSKGMQNNQPYAVLRLINDERFVCQAQTDSFGKTKEVICSFAKLPQSSIEPFEDQFFYVKTKKLKEHFFVIIQAKKSLYIKPIIFDLIQDNEVFEPKTQLSKEWIVVGYDKEIPFIEHKKQQNDTTIAFPFYMEFEELPYVGGLDLKGNPVHIKNSEDVKAFVTIKKLFDKKKYSDCIDVVNETLQLYPKTLFKAELLYYKIKSFYKLKSYDSVIDLSKEFLREYSSSENIPEVLLFIAVSYYKNGQYSDADYFFDRLFNEHSYSKFAQEGYIYKGDMALDGGEEKKAKKFYFKALHTTKDIDVALEAAFRIAKLYMTSGKYEQAQQYIEKILQANDKFFFTHYHDAKEMMLELADAQHYLYAAKIDEAILKYMRKSNDDYEPNLKNLGIWLSKTQEKQKAIAALDRYIKEFPDGDYILDIEKTRDALFFDTKTTDEKELLKKYDQLIATYKDDPIGQKALYEKALLMLKKKMYSDILQIKEQILALDKEEYPKKDEIIQQAILGLMENALENKQCGLVLQIQEENNVTIDPKWDDGLYECFIKAANYQKAKMIAKRDMQTKDIAQKEKWLYRYAKVSFATGNYTEAIEAAKDLIAMVDDITKSPYKDIYRTLFDAYKRVANYNGMIDTIEKIESLFGLSYKDIDRFVDMINVGIAKKDDNIIIKYGQKLYDLQLRTHSSAQSPFVEFALYQAYMNKEEYRKALEVIEHLDSVSLTPEEKARAAYQKGVVLEKLWRNEEAQAAYKAAIKADKDSAWGKLAQSALEMN